MDTRFLPEADELTNTEKKDRVDKALQRNQENKQRIKEQFRPMPKKAPPRFDLRRKLKLEPLKPQEPSEAPSEESSDSTQQVQYQEQTGKVPTQLVGTPQVMTYDMLKTYGATKRSATLRKDVSTLFAKGYGAGEIYATLMDKYAADISMQEVLSDLQSMVNSDKVASDFRREVEGVIQDLRKRGMDDHGIYNALIDQYGIEKGNADFFKELLKFARRNDMQSRKATYFYPTLHAIKKGDYVRKLEGDNFLSKVVGRVVDTYDAYGKAWVLWPAGEKSENVDTLVPAGVVSHFVPEQFAADTASWELLRSEALQKKSQPQGWVTSAAKKDEKVPVEVVNSELDCCNPLVPGREYKIGKTDNLPAATYIYLGQGAFLKPADASVTFVSMADIIKIAEVAETTGKQDKEASFLNEYTDRFLKHSYASLKEAFEQDLKSKHFAAFEVSLLSFRHWLRTAALPEIYAARKQAE